ncbi:MAG: ribonuclease domain-containing protein [Acidimicrobiales bacterium]
MGEQRRAGTGVPGWVWGMLVGLAIFAAGYWVGTSGGDETIDAGGGTFQNEPAQGQTTPSSTTIDTGSSVSETTELEASPPQFSDLPPILVTELPIEAFDTLDLIASGGPYPFDRDGLTFQNREGLLPDQPRGHYQEFTVVTPGEPTRGARRIVAGADGELYYTADHYSSFREIVIED